MQFRFDQIERAFRILTLSLLGAWLLTGSAVTPARAENGPATGGIVGHVRDGEGHPLADVKVKAFGPVTLQSEGGGSERETETDNIGRYEFSGLPAGAWTIQAKAEHRAAVSHQVQVHAGETSEVNFTLGPIQGELGAIEGLVRDAITSAPIVNARVSFKILPPTGQPDDPASPDTVWPSVQTGPDGHYRIGDLPPGNYVLQVRAEGYYLQCRRVPVEPNHATQANFRLLPIIPDLAGRIAGEVIDAGTSAPIAGAWVYFARVENDQSSLLESFEDIWLAHVRTDAGGRYETPPLRPGSYIVMARALGYASQRKPAEVAAGETTEVDFALRHPLPGVPGSIAGRVSDALTSAPIAGAWVFFWPDRDNVGTCESQEEELEDLPIAALEILPHVRTNEEGRYRIENLPPGEFHLRVEADHYVGKHREVEVHSNAVTEANFALLPRENERKGRIEGRVLDALHQMPIGGAYVFFAQLDGPTSGTPSPANLGNITFEHGIPALDGRPFVRTGPDGFYKIDGLKPGHYALIAWAAGFESEAKLAEVHSAETTHVDFALHPDGQADPGAIEGRVLNDRTGEPVAGAFVFYGRNRDHEDTPDWSLEPESELPSVRTDNQGRFRIVPLLPGHYHLAVRAEGFHPGHEDATVRPGESTHVEIRLQPREPILPGAIQGRVVDAVTSEPIAGALVYYGPLHNNQLAAEWWEDDHEDGGDDHGFNQLPAVQTDADGAYKIDALRPGDYHLFVVAPHYEKAHRRVSVESGRTTTADFRLKPVIPPASGAIEGLVYDALTSAPLAGARVHYRRLPVDPIDLDRQLNISGDLDNDTATSPPSFVVTDDEGHYRIGDLPAGGYLLLATAEGYRPRAARARVESNATAIVDFGLLPRDNQTGSVFGQVVDARTQEPLGEAHIWVVTEGDLLLPGLLPAVQFGHTTTDDQGRYRINGVPAGPVYVYAFKRHYRPAHARAVVPGGGEVEVDFALQPTHGDEVGALKGTVLAAETQRPLPGTLIVLTPDDEERFDLARRSDLSRCTVTDGNGQYGLRNVPAGWYRVFAIKEGYEKGRQRVRILAGEVSEANFMLPAVQHPRFGNLVGVVRDAVTSEPLAGALVRIRVNAAADLDDHDRWAARTDDQGHYEIRRIPAGDHDVVAFKRGYEPQRSETTIVGGRKTELNFSLTPVTQFGVIEGTVSDAVTSRPIANALVVVPLLPQPFASTEDTTLHARTDEQGHYRIGHVPAGLRTVVARARGHFPDAQLATVSPDAVTTVDFLLVPWPPEQSLRLRIRALDGASGQPLAGVRLHIQTDGWILPLSGWDELGGRTDADGWLELDDCPPGNWSLLGAVNGFQSRAITLDAAEPVPAPSGPTLNAATGDGNAQQLVLLFQAAATQNAVRDWTLYR